MTCNREVHAGPIEARLASECRVAKVASGVSQPWLRWHLVGARARGNPKLRHEPKNLTEGGRPRRRRVPVQRKPDRYIRRQKLPEAKTGVPLQ